MDRSLSGLLDFLDRFPVIEAQTWQGWEVRPILGGANNLLYRATGIGQDFAIKFTIRDARRRAWREFAALRLLQKAGLNLAPEPVWLDEDSYRQPVVVQSWLDGDFLPAPPTEEADWGMLVEHYIQIHSVKLVDNLMLHEPSVFNFSSCAEGKTRVYEHAARIPQVQWPVNMSNLLRVMEAWQAPDWSFPEQRLCRSDPNCRNFVHRGSAWFSVDWENSGWCDPAFELADLMAHPAYEQVSEQQLKWFVDRYVERSADEDIKTRVYADYAILLAWWTVRFARYLYEIPMGLDQRLSSPVPGWIEEIDEKYHRYMDRALAMLT